MPGTLLFDLDETLLVNPRELFLPAYLKTLGKAMDGFVPADQMIPKLLAATQKMTENRLPDQTLEQIFDAEFYPAIGIDKAALQATIDHFYATVFPNLKQYTSPRQEAKVLVENAFAAGYRVVIATNPVFPLSAIRQRLNWAELPVEHYPYSLVTSYETFHFSKPNPAYYAEILARIGWPDGSVVMVGESLEEDIFPSRKLGLAAYYTNPKVGYSNPNETIKPTASGELSEFWNWLTRIPVENLQPDYSSTIACVSILRAIPAVLHSLVDNLPTNVWTIRPAADQWTLNEISCHLRDVEKEVNLPRIKKILSNHDPFLTGLDTDSWVTERFYRDQDGLSALKDFIDQRILVLDILDSMEIIDWQRIAHHTFYGRTNLAEIVRIIASHERIHLQQFYQTLQDLLHSTSQ
jgi:FMN phosphatase YigB (HAD superfamily)